ncbi:hypothetical protein [Algoriphagus sp. CAU 1675]|uniref:hypothetical protein n=1 Tax=Algoriphagus sp. CAU 1675 TaxID=3032597 RepID=UPI0023D99EBF|nr:hypothetical protein [Algoriphagus sp. CAU 1675]MDF2156675.1 hypothetical protein [Algoriphagus sp. CAU 1675]
MPERSSNFRTESQELILPFFEKEPDWDQFHHYFFPDGREVFEVSLENATKYFPKSMLDSFPDRNPADFVIQNIMFIKNLTDNRFDPLIARYFPNNRNSEMDFNSISYNAINEFWEGKVDLLTYDEHHLVTFEFSPNDERKVIFYGKDILPNTRTQGDCYQITREVVYYTPIEGTFGIEINTTTITETVCTGAAGEFPTAGTVYVDGTYYYDGSELDPSGSGCGSCDYNPPSAPAPSEFIINQLDNECAEIIFIELGKGANKLTDLTGLGSLDIFPWMLDLFKKGGKFYYYIEDVNLPMNSNGTRPNARTITPDSEGYITIQLDNSYIENATSLSIARTIIHETVHAYIMYLSKTNYEFVIELNNYYICHNNNVNDAHHGMMSQYLLGMAVSLYNWDKNFGPTSGNLGFDYYYKMGFGGLLKNGTSDPISDIVPLIPNGDWDAIATTLENEATANSLAKGIKENCNE